MINQLIDIYNNRGDAFLNKLLSLPVTIYEKMAGCDFSFEKKKNVLVFFKKNTDFPINKIDRLLMKMYEPAIEYLNSLPSSVKKEIPEGVRFGFEYFPNKSPNIICYDRTPKNHLIISYVKNMEEGKVITDKNTLTEVATLLNVEPPAILFQGELSDKQKFAIIEFTKTPVSELKSKYKDKSFTEVLITLINSSLTKTILNNDLSKMIEGVVFSFENGETKAYATIIDPIFSAILSKNKSTEKNDMLHIILSDMIEYMEMQKNTWINYAFKKIDFDERYIEIISIMFNKFVKHSKDRYKDINLTVPKFMQASEFSINPYFLDNTKTIELISTSQRYAELFKIFVALFRKKKKKIAEFLSPVIIKYQNSLVDDIANKLKEGTNESFPTFEQFYSIYGSEELVLNENNIIFEEIDRSINENIEPTVQTDINESVNNHLKVLSFWQEAFSIQNEKAEIKKGKSVSIIIGKFQPFNNKHLKELQNYRDAKKKVIVVQINTNNGGERNPFNKKLSESMFAKIKEAYQKVIENIIIVKSFDLKKVINKINESGNYKIDEIICNEQYAKQISKQIEFYNVSEDLGFDSNIKIFEKNTDVKSNSQKIIDSLKEDNIQQFKKLVPTEIHILYNNFRDALKDK